MKKHLAVIIPVFNEARNVIPLAERLGATLKAARISYHLYFVDDHSTDTTVNEIEKLTTGRPISLLTKKGKQGKAFSILEAVAQTNESYLAMIDADLQYPPEAIPTMLKIAKARGVCVARRQDNRESPIRKGVSKSFQWLFGKVLHGLDCDVQSGLKVFKREIIQNVPQDVVTPWTLDIPLLTTALNMGYSIGQVEITFAKRNAGQSKIKFFSSISEIGGQAIKHKFIGRQPVTIAPVKKNSMIGAGLFHKGRRFVTHTTLKPNRSALNVVTKKQGLFIVALLAFIGAFLLEAPLQTAVVLVGILSGIYFLDVVFNLYLIIKSLHHPPEISIADEELKQLSYRNLPRYTILCPLYREAHVISQFLANIDKLDWPKKKLDVQLLLEEDDQESIDAVKQMRLPTYVRVVVVPDSQPKTKPKACNYGLSKAKGEYVVIFDAEDAPDPEQLKKSYLAFQKVGPNIKCLQAKLNYYNPHQNWLTRLFTAEYSLWFDVILTGLQSIQTTIPLGGTSNHFRTTDLKKMEGWDPFNVTEDADLGVRLFSQGYKTAIINSTTLEEANSNFKNWLRQRSRWIKGYMQTYLLHMRDPKALVQKQGIHALLFQLTVGGKIAFILINPFLWILTLAYFTLYVYVGPTIESLYPSVVFYMAVISLIFGNFMFIYYYMIGCAKRENWTLMKWIFLVPWYWIMVSIAGAIALYQLIVKPHYWEKTVHGLHLKAKKVEKKVEAAVAEATAEVTEEIKDTSGLALASLISQIIEQARVSLVKPFSFFSSQRFANFYELAKAIRSKNKWKTLFHDLVKGKYQSGMLLVAAMMAANVMNMATSLYLGQELRIEDFAVFTIYSSILSIVGIFSSAFSSTVNYKTASLHGRMNQRSIMSFWVRIKNNTILFSFVLAVIWLSLIPWFTDFFQLNSMMPLILFTPILLFSGFGAVNFGYLRGLLAFQLIAIITVIEAGTRLFSSLFFGELNIETFAYVSIPISVAVATLLSFLFAKTKKFNKNQPAKLTQTDYKLQKRFFFLALLSNLSGIAFFSLDNLLVAHYLTTYETGLYGIMGLLGKMIFFTGSLVIGFILPITAYQEGKGISPNKAFNQLLILNVTMTVCAWIVVGLIIPLVSPIFFGEKINAVRSLLPIYTLGILLYTISQAIVQFRLAKKHYLFPATSFAIALLQVSLLSLFHGSLQQVTWVMFVSGVLNFSILNSFHVFFNKVHVLYKNLRYFLDLFFGKIFPKNGSTANISQLYRILIFNWRDTKHVWAGGAEAYVHNLAKELVAKGHKVTIFCGNDGHHSCNDEIDGVTIIRRGGFYTVYIWAIIYYLLRLHGKFDIVIDSENGVPFFTPLYVGVTKFLLIYHIHQEVFRKHLPFPFSHIAMMIEAKIMPFVYQDIKVLTISESSRKAIYEIGLSKKRDITVINPGIESGLYKPSQKTKYPSIVYVGRLKSYKNVDIAIRAFAKMLIKLPTAHFHIAGDGEMLSTLKRMTTKMDLNNSVTFWGKVSNRLKSKLFAESWVAVQPSMIEGWGITVIEANASGTPVVASNVSGLSDSIINKKTGYLVTPKQVDEFAAVLLKVLTNSNDRKRLSTYSLYWAEQFTWTRATEKLLAEIEENNSQPKYVANRAQLALTTE